MFGGGAATEPGKVGARTGTARRTATRLVLRWIVGAAVGVGGAGRAGCVVLEVAVGGRAVVCGAIGIAWTADGEVAVEGVDAVLGGSESLVETGVETSSRGKRAAG